MPSGPARTDNEEEAEMNLPLPSENGLRIALNGQYAAPDDESSVKEAGAAFRDKRGHTIRRR